MNYIEEKKILSSDEIEFSPKTHTRYIYIYLYIHTSYYARIMHLTVYAAAAARHVNAKLPV